MPSKGKKQSQSARAATASEAASSSHAPPGKQRKQGTKSAPTSAKSVKGKSKAVAADSEDEEEEHVSQKKGASKVPIMAGALMCFAVRRGKHLWATLDNPDLPCEFREIVPEFPPVHKAQCPAEFAKWAPHWDDIHKLALSLKKVEPTRESVRQQRDWSCFGSGVSALVQKLPFWIRQIDKAVSLLV